MITGVSVAIVAFLFRPLFVQIEGGVKRVFYRDQYKLHRAMEDISHVLLTVRNPDEIFQRVFLAVENSLHVVSGVFLLRKGEGTTLEVVSSLPKGFGPSTPPLEVTHPLALYLLKTRKGLSRYQGQHERYFFETRDTYLVAFQAAQVEIFLPLIYDDDLLGMIGFNEKRSGDLYSSEDLSLLTALAHQIGVAVENARAYDKIKGLNAELETKVLEIQKQQNEILTLQEQLLNENVYLRKEVQQQFDEGDIVSSSPPMKEVMALVRKSARAGSTVFLRGEYKGRLKTAADGGAI